MKHMTNNYCNIDINTNGRIKTSYKGEKCQVHEGPKIVCAHGSTLPTRQVSSPSLRPQASGTVLLVVEPKKEKLNLEEGLSRDNTKLLRVSEAPAVGVSELVCISI
jgi:hypothetical protein